MTRANAASLNLQESSGRCDYQRGGLTRCGLYALDDVPVVESVHVVEDTVGRPEDPPNPHSLGEVLFVHDQDRSEKQTSELQSLAYLVCRLLLEKKKLQHATRYLMVDNE